MKVSLFYFFDSFGSFCLIILRCRVHMHHDMLYLREIVFYVIMYHFCDIMCFLQGVLSVDLDFHIDIDFVSEDACLQHIDPHYVFILHDTRVNMLFRLLIAGLAMESMTGNPSLAAPIPISAPTEENASERWCHASAINALESIFFA